MTRNTPQCLVLLVAVTIFAGGACRDAVDPLELHERVVADATVQFFGFEGGCWGITVADLFHYLPMNLPDDFRRDGLEVRVELKRRDDMFSYCFNPVVEIIAIRTR